MGTKRMTVLLLLLAGLVVPAWAAPDGPREQLQKAVDEIVAILKSTAPSEDRRARITEVYYRTFDVVPMAQMTMGLDWKGFPDERKAAFARKYGEFVLHFYIGKLESVRVGDAPPVQYTGLELKAKGTKAVVGTLVEYEGLKAKMDYSLRWNEKSGRWLIYDVEIEGVRLTTQFQAQFQGLLKDKGFDGMLSETDRLIEKYKAAPPDPVPAARPPAEPGAPVPTTPAGTPAAP